MDHAWWRKYDSFSGRWTSPDPYNGSMSVDDPQSMNRYAYVQNDPVNWIDPSGLVTSLNTNSFFIDGFGGFYYNVFGGGYEYWGQITGQEDGDPYTASFGHQGEFVEIFNSQITISQDGANQYITITDSLFFGVHAPGGPHGGEDGYEGGGGNQAQRKRSFIRCFERNRFSSLFKGTRLHGVAKFTEIIPPLSIAGDAAAIAAKAARSGIGGSTNSYASGLNYLFRRAANVVGSSALKGALTSVGNVVTPVFAVTGSFTTGYNIGTAIFCVTISDE